MPAGDVSGHAICVARLCNAYLEGKVEFAFVFGGGTPFMGSRKTNVSKLGLLRFISYPL
jgi:hypothetical protein